MDRREFLTKSAELMAVYGFFRTAFQTRAWASPAESLILNWVRQINETCHSVRQGSITAQQWQAAIEQLHKTISLDEIIRFTDLDTVVKGIRQPRQKIGAIRNIPWPELEGYTEKPPFGHKLFVYRKGACTPPHAHNHLVSAHLVLRGQIHVRTYDRVQDMDHFILIDPTQDRIANPGYTVSMSDYRNNVHWFEGVSDLSVSLDIPVPGIEPQKNYQIPAEAYNQIFLDASVHPRADGKIEAPVIPFKESLRRFA